MSKPSNTSKFIYFAVTFLFFTFVNFHFANLISDKVNSGWHFSNSLLNIIYLKNTGAAFSILQNSTVFLIIVSIVALLVMIYFVAKNFENIFMRDIFFLSILTSGIVGNLLERLVFGYVRDFFELTFVIFPVFNFSDVYINVGVLGIMVLILLTKKPIKIL